MHEPALRCSDWARAVGVDPVGTATSVAGWLLLEWPLPWPRDASEVEALARLHDALAGTGVRLQLVVPPGDATTRSVVLHRPPADADGWFAGYERALLRVEPIDVLDAALALVGGEAGGEAGAADGDVDVDVLVCGHGSRDRCCGSMGTALALDAVAKGIAVRRTSHTGGHRFAPTGVVLPSGTMWAFLDADALRRIVERSGDLDDLLPRYRGCSGVGSSGVQALERVAFGEVGWAWLDHRRRGQELGDGRVTLDAIAPDGSAIRWQGEVAAGRELPIPECGMPLEAAKKSETEVVIRSVGRVG